MTMNFSINALKEYTKKNKLPFIAHWNITEACNLRCTHCCVEKKPIYVNLNEAYDIIHFLRDDNFMLVTLSGGECTLHPDFIKIYLELLRCGLYVSIFTNGTHFTPEIKETLKKYKPRKVEVSIYGIDSADFERTTCSKYGYENFLDTLRFLKEANIRTVIKAPLTKKNSENISNYIDMAKQYGAEYKFGTFIFPALDGKKYPLNDRLEYQKAVSIEFKDEKHKKGFAERVNSKNKLPEPLQEKCAACSNSFTINADNSFSFCGMLVKPKFYFKQGKRSIEDAFEKVILYREEVISLYNNGPCKSCDIANICPGCPAHLYLENGTFDKCNQYFKDGTFCKLEYLKKENLINDPDIWLK